MRIGIFGGTFDPIHYGHLLAAEATREQLMLDRVLFVPARLSPLKVGIAPASDAHRVRMIELAIKENPAFALSTVDVDRPAPSFTVETVSLLQQQSPGHELFFLLGADALASLGSWKEPAYLLQLVRLAVVNRPGYQADLGSLPEVVTNSIAQACWVTMPAIGISGSELRTRVAAGRSIRYQVPEAVEAYIRSHNLYQEPQGEGRRGLPSDT